MAMLDYRSGNRLTLLKNGAQFFPALEAAIDAAVERVHLETYIFAPDALGQSIIAALLRAAARGVRVRVLLDGFGAADFPEASRAALQAAGAELLFFRPDVARLMPRRSRLRRLHRKLAVIDANVAFVGGINIIHDLTGHRFTAPRLDYAVAVEGPLVADILKTVAALWTLVSWFSFRTARRKQEDMALPKACGQATAAFVVRDNLRHRRDIEQAYLEAIQAARSEILIANPYFMPGLQFRRALQEAAARGVRVVLLLQGRAEFILVYYATLALYGELLRAGIHIFEYQESLLHAKVAVIDGTWATVGSSNIDPFSLLVAREANIVTTDAGFAGKLRRSLLAEIVDRSSPVTRAHFSRRRFLRRSLAQCCYIFLRALVGLTGLSLDAGPSR